MSVRYPAVAGRFYPGKEQALRKEIESCFNHRLGPGRIPVVGKGKGEIVGAVVPHAGYMYSGPVAAHVYAAIAKDGFPDTFVIIGPNHHGLGAGVAMSVEDFSTPLGVCKVDREMAEKLRPFVDDDPFAHSQEHSIEVQLPFLQYFRSDITILPITMLFQDYQTASELGSRIAKAGEGKRIVVIASSDFSHYVPPQVAKRKDSAVIEKILKLDPKAVETAVMSQDVSMCGYGPVMAMLEAVNGKDAQLLKYATSGDVSPMDEVVGYAGIVVTR
ncbi:MAG TPA: MEMO1 family protein [Methanomassiliicoccales archaeon]|nr:MEMO1 family protein [Methanomassiliicoccales archaeon]